jgi:hypothetical protein
VATDATDEHAQARRRLGQRLSVWHYLMAIAVVPCIGVAVLAGLVVTNVARDAADARRIERTMVSIQRLDDLNRANSGEATAVAIDNTLAALGVTEAQVRQLAGFVLPTTPAEAAATSDAALAALREDPSMADAVTHITARLAVARRGVTARARATGEAARTRAWASIQDYRAVTRAIAAAQDTAVDSVVTGRSGARHVR